MTIDIPSVRLSKQQTAVLRMWAAGQSYAEIGAALYIGETTVKKHLRRARDAYRNAGIHVPERRVGYMLIARMQGLI